MIDRLPEIQARLAAATPGPWRWGGHVHGEVRLETVGRGVLTILGTRRMGFAYPPLLVADRTQLGEPYGGVLHPIRDYAVKEVSYRDDIADIDHPDAHLIAAAPDDIAWLLREVRVLRRQIEDTRNDPGAWLAEEREEERVPEFEPNEPVEISDDNTAHALDADDLWLCWLGRVRVRPREPMRMTWAETRDKTKKPWGAWPCQSCVGQLARKAVEASRDV